MLEEQIRRRLRHKPLLIMTHIVIGYPSFRESWALAHAMVEAGVDLMELQIPFSEPMADGPVILDLQTHAGANRVAEQFDGARLYQSVPRLADVAGDLSRLLDSWRGGAKSFEVSRERRAADSVPVAERGPTASKHITRLWAYNEALRLIAARRKPEAIELAARYQLVTPASGAVVLESKEQFQRAGLEPVAANTVPLVPEPGGLLALAAVLGGGVWWWRRRKAGALLSQ